MLLMKTPDEVTGPINLGNPEEYSILADGAADPKLTASRSKIFLSPCLRTTLRNAGPMFRWPKRF